MFTVPLPLDTLAFPEVDENVALSEGMLVSLAETVTVGVSPEVNVGVQLHVWPGWMLTLAVALAASLSPERIGAVATIIISMTARTAKAPFVLLDIAFMVSFPRVFQAPVTDLMRFLYPAKNPLMSVSREPEKSSYTSGSPRPQPYPIAWGEL